MSSLGSVSFAVSKALMAAPVPLLREFLCAIGCVPDSRAVLQRCFKAGSSIAVTPGGWSEPIFTGGAYRLDISRLQRYLSLASAAGATLVPVLCLGEQLVSTDHLCNPEPCAWPTFARWVRLLLLATPPEPVHVVFGAPVTPQQGKSLQQLHRRYMQALSNLAKQYGVQYELVKVSLRLNTLPAWQVLQEVQQACTPASQHTDQASGSAQILPPYIRVAACDALRAANGRLLTGVVRLLLLGQGEAQHHPSGGMAANRWVGDCEWVVVAGQQLGQHTKVVCQAAFQLTSCLVVCKGLVGVPLRGNHGQLLPGLCWCQAEQEGGLGMQQAMLCAQGCSVAASPSGPDLGAEPQVAPGKPVAAAALAGSNCSSCRCGDWGRQDGCCLTVRRKASSLAALQCAGGN